MSDPTKYFFFHILMYSLLCKSHTSLFSKKLLKRKSVCDTGQHISYLDEVGMGPRSAMQHRHASEERLS